ncbi:unnamed protein product [Owenia fusiformis]|uniref:Uncharacterized protein n=1 Tax=Owenia fusiformis TaxID=6347 RepID=A0A8J1U2F0_OWEFU|nr:unnamed protein product [Owenia fusiformis]
MEATTIDWNMTSAVTPGRTNVPCPSNELRCWPLWVNVAVPIIMVVIFFAILTILWFLPNKGVKRALAKKQESVNDVIKQNVKSSTQVNTNPSFTMTDEKNYVTIHETPEDKNVSQEPDPRVTVYGLQIATGIVKASDSDNEPKSPSAISITSTTLLVNNCTL